MKVVQTSEMLVSFIIPVYNSDSYLRTCLDSLLEQGIESIYYEIICINDGSSDNSKAVLNQYANTYRNIIVINQENSGVSVARNQGLNWARGAYVWFVDADDIIVPNTLKMIEKYLRNNSADRIQVESYSFSNNLTEQEKDALKSGTLHYNMPYKDLLATRTLYKRDYLEKNRIHFLENVHYGEDGLFNYRTLIFHPITIHVNVLAYLYRRHSDSASNQFCNERVKKSLSGADCVITELVKDYNKKICIKETQRMLLYWMKGIIRDYSLLDNDYFMENFLWEYTISDIPFYAYLLRYLNNKLTAISNEKNYCALIALAKKLESKEEFINKKRKRKNLLVSYLKHPKRFLKSFQQKR